MALTSLITRTPWWVWCVFGYLIFRGVNALYTRAVHVLQLFVMPVVIVVVRLPTLAQSTAPMIALYGGACCIGGIIGFLTSSFEKIKIFKSSQVIEVPGSSHPLIMLLLFFALKYYFGFLKATDPVKAIQFAPWETCAAGLVAGFFIGRALNYIRRFLHHSHHAG